MNLLPDEPDAVAGLGAGAWGGGGAEEPALFCPWIYLSGAHKPFLIPSVILVNPAEQPPLLSANFTSFPGMFKLSQLSNPSRRVAAHTIAAVISAIKTPINTASLIFIIL
jgi:hypothetical protein